jgi:hypothetical protein
VWDRKDEYEPIAVNLWICQSGRGMGISLPTLKGVCMCNFIESPSTTCAGCPYLNEDGFCIVTGDQETMDRITDHAMKSPELAWIVTELDEMLVEYASQTRT